MSAQHTPLKYTLPFSKLDKNDIPIAGGKGANLGEMFKAKIPVPDGFVVTSNAYYKFIEDTGLSKKIRAELKGLDLENSKALQKAAENIK